VASERLIDVFFYGLFMDADILEENQVIAINPRPGYVEGFALRIGQRAALVPAPDARAYGMIMAISGADLARLYAAPGLELYHPEAVLARTLEGEAFPALCYNLGAAPGVHERNPEYAARLQRVLQALGFPPEYVASVC
jgi:hypothetical protein